MDAIIWKPRADDHPKRGAGAHDRRHTLAVRASLDRATRDWDPAFRRGHSSSAAHALVDVPRSNLDPFPSGPSLHGGTLGLGTEVLFVLRGSDIGHCLRRIPLAALLTRSQIA
jgi:hypothetical protein